MAAIHHYRNALGAASSFDTEMEASIRAGELGLATDAVLASAASAGIVIDDPDGSIAILGKQRWEVDEDAAPAQATLSGTVAKTAGSVTLVGTGTSFVSQLATEDELKVGSEYLFVQTITDNTHVDVYTAPTASASGLTVTRAGRRRMWSGRTAAKHITRGMTRADGGEIHAAGRSISVDLLERQDLLHSRIPYTNGSGGTDNWNRPAETMAARLTFMLASTIFSNLGIFDDGFVDYPTFSLEKTDYQARFLDEILNDLAQRSNQDLAKPAKRNIGVFYHEAAGHFALWFRTLESFAYPSPVRISNDSADEGGANVYMALEDPEPELVEDPEGMASRVVVPRARSFNVRELPATEDTIGPWDINTPNANLKSSTAANAYADAILKQEATEDQTVTAHILVPAAKVNDVREFQQCRVKMTHFDGWQTERWARVVHREIREAQANGTPAPWLYDVGLKLTPAKASSGSVSIRQTAAEIRQPSVTFTSPTAPGDLLLTFQTWRQLLTSPQPPDDGETWTLLGIGPFVDDHDAPDPCAIVCYAAIATIAQAAHHKQGATGGDSNGTVIHSVMYEIPGAAISDLRTITSGPNLPATSLDIGSLGDIALAFGAWGNGWDGFFVSPIGIQTTNFGDWTRDYISSRDFDSGFPASSDALFGAGFAFTSYAHTSNKAALEALITISDDQVPHHWGGVAVGIAS